MWLPLDTTNMDAISVDGTLRFDIAALGTVVVTRNAFYDLAESELSVRVQLTNNDAGSFVQLGAAATGSGIYGAIGDVAVWRLSGGILKPGILHDNQFMSVGPEAAYDPDVHQVWALSRTGDTVVWSHSDGTPAGEVVVATNANLPWARTIRPVLTGQKSADSADFTIAWDDLDGGGTPDPACSADQLIADFTAANDYDHVAWNEAQVRSCVWSATTQQGLRATLSNTDAICRIESATLYDLIDHAIVVELDTASLETHVATVELLLEDGRVADFREETGALRGRFEGIDVGTGTARPFVRFRGVIEPITNQGKLFWEVSSNGIDFEPLGEFSRLDGLDRVQLRLALTGKPTGAPGAELRFRGVNVPRP